MATAGRSNPLSRSVVSGEPQTQEEANQIILELQGLTGYLSQETLEYLENSPAKYRDETLAKFAALRREAAKLVVSATELNSKDVHFIHEILQNADDSCYSNVRSTGGHPWIRFEISEKTIIIETNEDGFTRADVDSICRTRESSKKHRNSTEHIGEKGIGFKSVFRVSNKVRIDSGYWHFHFDHAADDDGLGMVTPIPDDPVELPPEVGTRITLSLNERHRKNYTRIIKEFKEMHETTIFFLRNITEVNILISTMVITERTAISLRKEETQRRSLKMLTRAMVSVQGPVMDATYYEVFRSPAIDMPKDPRRAVRRAFIDLAFPVDKTSSRPILDERGQYVFAYLPLYRSAELHFLIQSDFITTSSRESTDDCDWNDNLLEATADTFCDAIAHFCNHQTLLFEWPTYLPALPIEGLFAPLRDLILEKLQGRPIFRTWTSERLDIAAELCIVPPHFLYKDQPILNDIPGAEIYLAKEYSKHQNLLRKLGAKELKWSSAFERLSHDLLYSETSLVRTTTSKSWSGWHEKLAEYFLPAYQNPRASRWQEDFDALKLIPLLEGKWIASPRNRPNNMHAVVFTTVRNVEIPRDLGYDFVDVDKTTAPQRWQLLHHMGVKECKYRKVADRIFQHHESESAIQPKYLADHLYFLYQFSHSLGDDMPQCWVATLQGSVVRSDTDVYLQSQRPYSSDRLLQKISSSQSSMIPPFNTWLLHSSYSDATRSNSPESSLSFKQWLGQEIGIREFPALTRKHNGCMKLSPILNYVLSVSSRNFLDTLQARWHDEYGSRCRRDEASKNALRNCKVECRNGSRLLLSNTYLPVKSITETERGLGMSKLHNVLNLESEEDTFEPNEWLFLTEVGVRSTVDLDFYLDALFVMSSKNISEKVKMAYDFIGANTNMKQKRDLRVLFSENGLIYDSSSPPAERWRKLGDCVWEGPSILTVRRQISTRYENDENIRHLFVNILEIPNATPKDIIEQIKALKSSEQTFSMLNSARDLYVELSAMIAPSDLEELRLQFASEELIYVGNGWARADHCLWSAAISINGRPVLAPLYPVLENFFTQQLKIQKADVGTIIAELIRKAKLKQGLNVEEAKTFMFQISAMLSYEPPDSEYIQDKLDELGRCKFLPIRIGRQQPYLAHIFDEFVIRDHAEYNRAFQDQAPFLDFTFEEVPQISALVEEMSMTTSYVSELVEERSKVGDDATLHDGLTDDFRRKAYNFFCCAYKFRSRRLANKSRTLLDELLRISVFTSSTIATELVLELKDSEYRSDSANCQMHFEFVNGEPCLFVPQEPKLRRSCFRSKVPNAILTLMGLEGHESALNQVTHLAAAPLSDIEDVMQDDNIPSVPWVDATEVQFKPVRNDDSEIATERMASPHQQTSNQRPSTAPIPSAASSPVQIAANADSLEADESEEKQVMLPSQPTYSAADEQNFRFGSGPPPALGRFNFGSPPPMPDSTRPRQDRYEELLDQIIRVAARQKDVTQRARGVFELSSLSTTLPGPFSTDTTFGPPGLHRDFKIGAAGELFVFEQLSHLGLPNFGLHNWQSRIRDRVSVHPKYSNLEAWPAQETADIVYRDSSGKLMQWLQKMSIEFKEANAQKPFTLSTEPNRRDQKYQRHPFHGPITKDVEFYIEVKSTTTLSCDTRFFMSANEYKLMQEIHDEYENTIGLRDTFGPKQAPWQQPPKRIYVFIRVSNLMSEGLGMKVFVDPLRYSKSASWFWTGLEEGDSLLRFEADSWIVYPKTGF